MRGHQLKILSESIENMINSLIIEIRDRTRSRIPTNLQGRAKPSVSSDVMYNINAIAH